jgi:hypothetical protein
LSSVSRLSEPYLTQDSSQLALSALNVCFSLLNQYCIELEIEENANKSNYNIEEDFLANSVSIFADVKDSALSIISYKNKFYEQDLNFVAFQILIENIKLSKNNFSTVFQVIFLIIISL